MRLTAKERILLYLLENASPEEAAEVSPAVTREEVARASWISTRHLPQYVRPLVRDGLVHQRQAHVEGIRQRRNVYELTDAGRRAARRLREELESETIRVRDANGIRETTVSGALDAAGTAVSVLDLFRQVSQGDLLDLARLTSSAGRPFVEMIADAPRVDGFVGRVDELNLLTTDGEGPPMVVVRGIAGIGKSSLAAKACELLRGRRNLFWHRVRSWESAQTILSSVGRFLVALDRPGLAAVLSRGEAARALEILREDLAETRSFLVFDDAQETSPDALSVFRMLMEAVATAPDVRILVLSRRALSFYGRRAVVLDGLVAEIELSGLTSDQAAAVLGPTGDSSALVGLGRPVGGHPLFLQLVRAHRPLTTRGLRDVRRFIEEEIYAGLTNPQRTIMKAGSLYRMPVPREAFLANAESSYEDLVSLMDQSLLRLVGDDRYEIHETVRDFFAGILLPEERRKFEERAVGQLRVLASEASKRGEAVACIAYLSNALAFTKSPDERRTLCEALADANEGIGDLPATSMAYREATGLATNNEDIARLRRKLASALQARGQLAAALTEAREGLAVLRDSDSVERGWLALVRSRISQGEFDYNAAQESAEDALGAFQRFNERSGEAQALLELGDNATMTGKGSEPGAGLAERCFQSALDLASSLADPILAAKVHLAMMGPIGYRTGDYEAGMSHLRAVASSPGMTDPFIRSRLHLNWAWFVMRINLDCSGAESELAESQRVARKIHDTLALANVTYLHSLIARHRGQYAEAGRLMERAVQQMLPGGSTAFAANASFSAFENYLAAGDWEGFDRVGKALRTPPLARGLERNATYDLSYRGITALVRGDVEEFERAFGETFRQTNGLPADALPQFANLWRCHFHFAIGLRALGREPEAAQHLTLAVELLRGANNRLGLALAASDFGERIMQTFRAWKRSGGVTGPLKTC